MKQALKAELDPSNSDQDCLPIFELVESSRSDVIDFNPTGRGTDNIIPGVCFTDAEIFRHLVGNSKNRSK